MVILSNTLGEKLEITLRTITTQEQEVTTFRRIVSMSQPIYSPTCTCALHHIGVDDRKLATPLLLLDPERSRMGQLIAIAKYPDYPFFHGRKLNWNKSSPVPLLGEKSGSRFPNKHEPHIIMG